MTQTIITTQMRNERRYIIGPIVVRDLGDGQSFVITPRGRRLYLAIAPALLSAWVQRCDGTRGRAELESDMPDEFAQVVDLLLSDGVLQEFHGEVDPCWLRAPHGELHLSRLKQANILIVGDVSLSKPLFSALNGLQISSVEQVPLADLADALSRIQSPVVFGAFMWPAEAEFADVERVSAAAGAVCIPVLCREGRLFMGPLADNESGVTRDDLVRRRHAAISDVRVHDALFEATRDGFEVERLSFTAGEITWAAATIAAHAERWITGAYSAASSASELELDPIEMSVVSHPVLPLPDRPDPSPAPAVALGPKALMDAQTGVVTRVRAYQGFGGTPPGLHLAVAHAADMTRLTNWPNDPQAFGSSWNSSQEAQDAAVGEAVERYCTQWASPDRNSVHGSYRELRRQGLNPLDPRRLALYSKRQYASQGFPYPEFTPDSPATWVLGRSLTANEDVWVPACIVYVPWHRLTSASEPEYMHPVLAGTGAGRSSEQAMVSALGEVIERDASMVWWANAPRLPAVALPRHLSRLLEPVADRFEVRLIPIENDHGVPVMAAVVKEVRQNWITMGFAARADGIAAAEKALAEGFMLQMTCQALDSPNAAGTDSGLARRTALKPWRLDRCYLDSYRPDFSDVTDMMCQQQLYLDDRAGDRTASWTWDLPERPWEGLPRLPDASLATLRRQVEDAGREVIAVDVTTSDIARTGMHVTRVVVPGLVSNFPAARPQWGGGRIQQAAVTLGWHETQRSEEALNTFPMPHA